MSEAVYDTFEDELDAIRLQMYEETKDMTPEEEIAYIRVQTEPIMKQYNIKYSTLRPYSPALGRRMTEEEWQEADAPIQKIMARFRAEMAAKEAAEKAQSA